ncbi:MAG: hypothetical protein ACE5EE_10395 [Fidelibacterota bacterium]
MIKHIYRNGQWYDSQGRPEKLKPNLSHITHGQAPGISGFMPESVRQFLSNCAGHPIESYSDLDRLGLSLDQTTQRQRKEKTNVSRIFKEKFQKAQDKHWREKFLEEKTQRVSPREEEMAEPGVNEEIFDDEAPLFDDIVEMAKKKAQRNYRDRKARG